MFEYIFLKNKYENVRVNHRYKVLYYIGRFIAYEQGPDNT